ncbi:hypothetical protein KSC_033310 [Ktedonobacter sp. SOSP1-52]|nr:hypothetical protein KSC_033310 [Ktedonobacter sp. SOSP1-52]
MLRSRRLSPGDKPEESREGAEERACWWALEQRVVSVGKRGEKMSGATKYALFPLVLSI